MQLTWYGFSIFWNKVPNLQNSYWSDSPELGFLLSDVSLSHDTFSWYVTLIFGLVLLINIVLLELLPDLGYYISNFAGVKTECLSHYGSCPREIPNGFNTGLKMPLPTFGMASYKFKISVWGQNGVEENQKANSLLRAADEWLRALNVHHPDYSFFVSKNFNCRWRQFTDDIRIEGREELIADSPRL